MVSVDENNQESVHEIMLDLRQITYVGPVIVNGRAIADRTLIIFGGNVKIVVTGSYKQHKIYAQGFQWRYN